MPVKPGAAIRRRQLGLQLREHRLAAGMPTMEVAAEESGLSRATISRVEGAKQTILPRTVRLLGSTYGVGVETIQAMLLLADDNESRGWLTEFGNTVPDWFQRYLAEEGDAREICSYQGEFIPGLLQTEDYCRAIILAANPSITTAKLDQQLNVRLSRQVVLDRAKPPKLSVVINEAALRRLAGSSQVMRAQLAHLIELADRPKISIQVLPFAAGAHPAMTNSFILLRFPSEFSVSTTYVETLAGASYPDGKAEDKRYAELFKRLCGIALSPDDTVPFLTRVRKEL